MKYFIIGTVIVFILAGIFWPINNIRHRISDAIFHWRYDIEKQSNIMVLMRDGKRLSTDVYKPDSLDGPYPTILIRTTYGGVSVSRHKWFVENDYAVVVQHVRGRHGSEGDYHTHRYTRQDGYDTIDWIIKQDWSNGKVGTFGCSYLGETQNILAAAKHPNHIAMITIGGGGAIGSAMGSYGYFGVYENGVLDLASALGWYTRNGAVNQSEAHLPKDYEQRLAKYIGQLPVAKLANRIVPYKTGYDDLVEHSLTDPWWIREGYVNGTDTFTTATLHVNTWFDQTVHDTFRLAQFMKEHALNERAKHQYVLIGPGNHCDYENYKNGWIQVGDLAINYKEIDYESIFLNWFNYWLKDEHPSLPPNFKYFLLRGAKWESSQQWPPKGTGHVKYYLSASSNDPSQGSGQLQHELPQDQAPDSYVYDPADPVPTIGGSICCTGRDDKRSGPLDQRTLSHRKDVLAFLSTKLERDIIIAGNAKVTLYVSTNARDTDFTAKLIDKFPKGQEIGIRDGVVRLRYRNGIDKVKLAEPGVIYKIEIELRPIAYRFESGHQIVIQLSSSNFPRLARNLNTGENEYQDARIQKAVNSIYHDASHPSFLELPAVIN